MRTAGRNKLVINHLEKLFITSDAAVICKELEVIHPAANVTVMAVKQQEEEVNVAAIRLHTVLFYE